MNWLINCIENEDLIVMFFVYVAMKVMSYVWLEKSLRGEAYYYHIDSLTVKSASSVEKYFIILFNFLHHSKIYLSVWFVSAFILKLRNTADLSALFIN